MVEGFEKKVYGLAVAPSNIGSLKDIFSRCKGSTHNDATPSNTGFLKDGSPKCKGSLYNDPTPSNTGSLKDIIFKMHGLSVQ